MFVAAQCTTLLPFLYRSYSLVRLILAVVGQTFSLSLNPLTADVYYLLIMIKYSLNPLTAVPLVLCDSRALLSLGLNSLWQHNMPPHHLPYLEVVA
jgi:hypothetical protein